MLKQWDWAAWLEAVGGPVGTRSAWYVRGSR